MEVVFNIKSCNYLLTSMIDIKRLVNEASLNNISALGLADNNMYGALEFYKECKKKNIKPIIGLEIVIDDKKAVLYAKNYEGYQGLLRISNDVLLMDEYASNLVVVVPYESMEIVDKFSKFNDLFIGYKTEEEKKNIDADKAIYMRDILCLYEEEEKYLRYLNAIRKGTLASDEEDVFSVSMFPLKGNSDNDKVLCDLCNLEIKFNQDLLPSYPCDNSFELLKSKCIDGLKKIFGNTVNRKYQERLKHELNIIKEMGFCDYFLIVSDYVNYAKDNDILVGPGRGSAAGSLVSYLLNITTIDPLKYDLLFERFLNPERISMPDIDVDFEDNKRDRVIDYCAKKYGKEKVASIITFGTLKSKAVIRDVGRVLAVDLKKIDALCKEVDVNKSLSENLKSFRVNNLLKINSDLNEVYDIALKFEGLKRHTSVHAAGIVISNSDLNDVVPVDIYDDINVIGYDKDYLEELGLLKMDFLGLKNLSLISNILSDIDGLTFDTIPENDKKAIKVFYDADTTCVFQFEKEGMINFLSKLKATSFDDVAAALALYRPGPMKNIDSYIRRKEGREKINYYDTSLEDILKSTYGIIVYQEQIMQIAVTMAGYTLAEADNLRKAMSKKKEDILLKEKDKFIKQSVDRGYAENIALDVYNLILKFAEYGFNKSHTIAYAMIAYRMAYLKAHYPKIFMKHLLNGAINSESKTKEYIYECKKIGVNVLKPDINVSTDKYEIKDGYLVFPLSNIKGLGISAINTIMDERKNGEFEDVFDFVRRCDVNANVLENLIMSSAFDNLGYNKKTLMQNIEVIRNYGEIGEYLDNDVFKPDIDIIEEYSKEDIMEKELGIFGFYLSNHPVTEYKSKYKNCVMLNQLNTYFDKQVNIIVCVDKVREVITKKNDKMAFISGSDEISKVDVVLFPNIYDSIKLNDKGDILLINGKVEKRFDKLQVVADKITKLN